MKTKAKSDQGTTRRIFTYQGDKFDDPLPGHPIENVQVLLAQSLPELVRCAWSINIDTEGMEVIEFTSTRPINWPFSSLSGSRRGDMYPLLSK